jgi:hypothetical protein
MAAKLDRLVIALIFLLIFSISTAFYFFVNEEVTKIIIFTLSIVSSGGFGYSLARIIVRR